jgi:purine-binding chemotaxis protein CheW
MNESDRLVTFLLDEQRYALNLAVIEKAVRIAEITPLPSAPEIVMGVVNVQGRVLPVINIRRRFHLPEREIQLSDQLIIARTAKRTVALLADGVSGVIDHPERDTLTTAEEILPEIAYVKGVVRLDGQLIFIYDLDQCLSLEEEDMLDEAMERA